ncbi:hypothetical protein BDZ45DRAFT_682348 [Acephala macrosclerotiorum]|nr:hypothetical protein BDZ45DRAFT_682348 [Acephala macrosclerotiorum]
MMSKFSAIMAKLPATEVTTRQPVIEHSDRENFPNEGCEAHTGASPPIQPPPSQVESSSLDQLTPETSSTSDTNARRRAAIIDDAVSKFKEQFEMTYLDLHNNDEVQIYQQTEAILSRIVKSKKPDSKLNMLALASGISDIRPVFDVNVPALDISSRKLPPLSVGREMSPNPIDEPPSPGSSIVTTESEVLDPTAGPEAEKEQRAERYDPRMMFRDAMLSHAQKLETDDLVSLLGYMDHIVDTMSSVLNEMTTVMQSLPTEEGS